MQSIGKNTYLLPLSPPVPCLQPQISNSLLFTSNSAVKLNSAILWPYHSLSGLSRILLMLVPLSETCLLPSFAQITPYQPLVANSVDISSQIHTYLFPKYSLYLSVCPPECDQRAYSLKPQGVLQH